MRTRTPEFRRVLSKTIPLTGGLNEQVSNLELTPGELFECINYEEIDGSYHGYRSFAGFERWDGTVTNYEYPFGSGEYVEARYPSDVPVTKDDSGVKVTEGYTITHEERDGRRLEILPIPGFGPALYCGYYQGELYAIREDIVGELGTGFTKMWRMDEGTDPVTDPGGWVEITEWPADVPANDVYDNPYRTTECQLSDWPPTAPNTESLCFACGCYEALMLHRDSLGVHTVEPVIDPNLPIDNKPTIPQFFDNRLYLAYREGHLFFSELGKITYDAVFFAGEIYLGWPITDMVVSPGSAIILWTEKGIKILERITEAGEILSPVIVNTFSDRSSSIPMTAQRFLGTMIFSDDRGVTLLETSDAFGDFKAASISKRVHRTYEENRSNILGALVNRSKNQYVLFFKDGAGIVFTFDIEKKVKGATFINTSHPMSYVNEGKDSTGSDKTVAGDLEGYVQFFREEAQSFDGEVIHTRLATAFHNYGSAVNRKQFKKILFELSAMEGMVFTYRCDYDYNSLTSPKGSSVSPSAEGSAASSAWGSAVWGNFTWSGNLIEQVSLYLAGWGINMSLVVATASDSYDPHTIHNFTTNYSMGSIRQ